METQPGKGKNRDRGHDFHGKNLHPLPQKRFYYQKSLNSPPYNSFSLKIYGFLVDISVRVKKFMKCKQLLGIVSSIMCVTLGLVLVSGCVTPKPVSTPPAEEQPAPKTTTTTTTEPAPPPPSDPALSPFTIGILNRLRNEAEAFTIDQCQFFLSGGITLERIDEEKDQRAENGTAVFIDNISRREIIINEKTEGAAFRILQNQNEMLLPLCFDQEDRYQLAFSATRNENSQFFLRFNQQNDPSSDARGNLVYGGQRYRLRFNGGIPYLMIKLTEKQDPVRNQNEVSGRKVTYASTATFDSSVPITTEIFSRMKRSEDFSINQYQFYLSGAITLERFNNQKKVSVIEGAVVFEDNPTSWHITFKDRAEGVAIDQADENEDETNLHICFDQDEGHQLVFSASARDPQSQFFLKFIPLNDPLDDARGNIEYAGQDYRLRFSGGRPHLRISLRKEVEDTTEQHTVPGRRASNRTDQVTGNN
jgi:hypothetical protein